MGHNGVLIALGCLALIAAIGGGVALHVRGRETTREKTVLRLIGKHPGITLRALARLVPAGLFPEESKDGHLLVYLSRLKQAGKVRSDDVDDAASRHWYLTTASGPKEG